MQRLASFDPHVAGTPPLGIDVPGSDIDILCHAPDLQVFADKLWSTCAAFEDFSLHQWTQSTRPILCTFTHAGWAFEIFGDARPITQQEGWRHFCVEQRLLALGGSSFQQAILDQRYAGLKTEPAFAAVLGLAGDPYEALLALDGASDEVLVDLLK
jgi:hypothetical protein